MEEELILLDKKDIVFSYNIVEVDVVYKKLIDLSIFEKYIVKVIQKATNNHIPISADEKGINYIANILKIDETIISNNIILLSEAGHLKKSKKAIEINSNENLDNFKKEKFFTKKLEFYLEDDERANFHNYNEDEKEDFIKNKMQINENEFFCFYENLNLESTKKVSLLVEMNMDKREALTSLSEDKRNANIFFLAQKDTNSNAISCVL